MIVTPPVRQLDTIPPHSPPSWGWHILASNSVRPSKYHICIRAGMMRRDDCDPSRTKIKYMRRPGEQDDGRERAQESAMSTEMLLIRFFGWKYTASLNQFYRKILSKIYVLLL